jgi:cytoskeletal protein RodZ
VVAVTAAFLLGFTIWIAGGPWRDDTPALAAAAAMQAPTPAPTTTTTVPSTTIPPPSTTTSKPTTTTPKTSKKSSATTASSACSTDLAGTQPQVAQAGNYLKAMFGVDKILGRAGRAGESDHPSGLALDFMVDTATGNKLADYVLANQSRLGVKYVIWRQRYNDGSGWSAMEDRGSVTANHYDHVHVSFQTGAKVSVTC